MSKLKSRKTHVVPDLKLLDRHTCKMSEAPENERRRSVRRVALVGVRLRQYECGAGRQQAVSSKRGHGPRLGERRTLMTTPPPSMGLCRSCKDGMVHQYMQGLSERAVNGRYMVFLGVVRVDACQKRRDVC